MADENIRYDANNKEIGVYNAMQSNKLNLPAGMSMRPALDGDRPFIESLYKSTRDDLRLIDAEDDFIEALIEQQHYAQTVGYGEQFPNAMYFIVEKVNEPIGRVVIDFGPAEVRVVDISLIPTARNQGFGKGILQSLQYAAASTGAPLTLSVATGNVGAIHLYNSLGFRCVEQNPAYNLMAWYPGQL